MDPWLHFLTTGEIPDFPERGKYRAWDKSWNPIGYADEPQYRGQQPTRFPPEWSAAQCFLANSAE